MGDAWRDGPGVRTAGFVGAAARRHRSETTCCPAGRGVSYSHRAGAWRADMSTRHGIVAVDIVASSRVVRVLHFEEEVDVRRDVGAELPLRLQLAHSR